MRLPDGILTARSSGAPRAFDEAAPGPDAAGTTTTGVRAVSERVDVRRRIPGEAGLWVFILGDMCVFAMMFGSLMVYRAQHSGDFLAGQANLHPGYGMLNTVVLLTSSLLVVNGLRHARVRSARARLFLGGAIACGATFAVVKGFEYTHLVRDGHTIPSSDFYMYYFTFTSIHLVHVAMGTLALVVAMRLARPVSAVRNRTAVLEGIASFWHLVDLLWIVLFALLYLMP